MSIDKQFVLDALLQHNFMPHQKEEKEDVPPIITSDSFSETVAKSLVKIKESSSRKARGYDAVEYKLTRFNGVPRVLSIPHPKAYANLALSISNNWAQLEYIAKNSISKIIPQRHRDGRLIIMDYGNRFPKAQDALSLSFGYRYIVRTDISNFYPSIYSHSIPWALVGI